MLGTSVILFLRLIFQESLKIKEAYYSFCVGQRLCLSFFVPMSLLTHVYTCMHMCETWEMVSGFSHVLFWLLLSACFLVQGNSLPKLSGLTVTSGGFFFPQFSILNFGLLWPFACIMELPVHFIGRAGWRTRTLVLWAVSAWNGAGATQGWKVWEI